jgi:hypothetical protein
MAAPEEATMQYAEPDPTVGPARPTHWSDRLKPGTAWCDLGFQITLDVEEWAAKRDTDTSEAMAEFAALIAEIQIEVTRMAAEMGAMAFAEIRTPGDVVPPIP